MTRCARMDWRLVLGVPWGVFGLVWIVSAAFAERAVHREPLAARAAYGSLLVLGVALLFSSVGSAALPPLALQLVPDAFAVKVAGAALTCLGVAIAVWARATLGRMWSGRITLKEGHHLVQTGPYRVTRHPIYTGLVCAFFGSMVTMGTLRAVLGFALATAAFLRKLFVEERLMAAQFGEEHRAWAQKTKLLIPFVW